MHALMFAITAPFLLRNMRLYHVLMLLICGAAASPTEQGFYHGLKNLASQQHLENHFQISGLEAELKLTNFPVGKHLLIQNGAETGKAFQPLENQMEVQPVDKDQAFTTIGSQSNDVHFDETKDENKALDGVLQRYGSDEPKGTDLAVPIVISLVIAIMFICCCCLRRCRKTSVPTSTTSAADLPVYIHDGVPAAEPSSSSYTQFMAPLEMREAIPFAQREEPNVQGARNSWEVSARAAPGTAAILDGMGGGGGTGEAGARGGGVRHAPDILSTPSDSGYQYQPKGWPGGFGDFLSSSPLGSDTENSTVYNSPKLNF